LGGEVGKKNMNIKPMKKLFTLLLFIVTFEQTYAQQSLDSLRMVLPVGHTEEVTNFEISPNNKYIVSKTFNEVIVWERFTTKLINNKKIDAEDDVYFSQDSKSLILVKPNAIEIIDIFSWATLKKININESLIVKSAISLKNDKIVIHTEKNKLAIIDLGSFEMKYVQLPKKMVITNFDLRHPGGFLTVMTDKKIIIYDINSCTILKEFNIKANAIDSFHIVYNPHNQYFIIWKESLKKSQFNLYGVKDFKLFQEIALKGSISDIVFSPNGNKFLTVIEGPNLGQSEVQIWDINSRCKKYQTLNNIHATKVNTAAFDDSGNKIITGDNFGYLRIWDIKGGSMEMEFGIGLEVMKVKLLLSDELIGCDNDGVIFSLNLTQSLLRNFIPRTIAHKTIFSDNEMYIVERHDSLTNIKSLISRSNFFSFESPIYSKTKWMFTQEDDLSEFIELDQYVVSFDPLNMYDFPIYIWEKSSGKLLHNLTGHQEFILHASFEKKSNILTSISSDLNIRNWNVETGICINSIILLNSEKQISYSDISPKNKIFVASFIEDKYVYLWNLEDLSLKKIDLGNSNFKCVKINSVQNEVLIYSMQKLYSYSIIESKIRLIDTLDFILDSILDIELVSDGQKLIIYSENRIYYYDLNSKSIKIFQDNGVKFLSVNQDGSQLSYCTNEQKSVLFDLTTGKRILENYQLLNNNWLVKLPNSPYYMCSKDASKMLHYVTPSLKVIGFEQLDPVYNRPDIVLDSIGKYIVNVNRGMIDEYRKSWEKRINKLGLDVDKLGKGEIAVPSAEILDADDIAYENNNGELEIKVSANDAKYPLRRFNVYVNEVPLYGSAGVSIAHLNKQVWDTTISVPLSVGENKIQVSVMNELGLENFKYPTYVNYAPQEQLQSKTYYIGIGVNEFAQSAHNLKYCVKDVRDLAKSFSTENSNTDTLLFTNEQVTRENILALKTILLQTSVNDKVIISCSSHGLLDDSLNFYLAMHDVDFNNPKLRGLKYEELESLLDSIPARQKLLLLDACNSGENDKTELLKKEIEQNQNQMDTTQLLVARGVVVKIEEENTNNFKKMNELFVNVRNNTGSVIISAAGGQESALEAISVDGKTIENGAFTYSILECLKQNEGKELKVNALKQYAEKRVEEITNGKQKPTSRQETMEIDWEVR
jgi:WD40 repeat protein